MSFTIQLYTNTSPRNFVTKTITQVGTDLTGDLRQETSIVRPGIIVELDSVPASVNYMYISDWGRYYFIEDIISVRAGLWELRGSVDPLYTYATQLKACSGIVHRAESESAYNLNLNDGSFKAYANPEIRTMKFTSGFTSQDFVLAVAGGRSAN